MAASEGGDGLREQNGVRYIFGLGSNAILAEQIFPNSINVASAARPASWKWCAITPRPNTPRNPGPIPRRVVARIEVTRKGADVRYVRSLNLTKGTAQWLYDHLYCARGQAENLIKRHKSQLASDRTSCRSPLANQMRLICTPPRYWLVRTVREMLSPGRNRWQAVNFPP